ncbi:unnamed protein product [Rodentolepis nana]|uniref:SCP domain-containing protein n=1 Tax=Rodentolepis nana TaxID=102285 RepID=A0A0R3TI98_RODNA|nr:unnamed protein product [Rodentolepis nana]
MIVGSHNLIRRTVDPAAANMLAMEYSPDLGSLDDSWAQKCKDDDHTMYQNTSRNIYLSFGLPTEHFPYAIGKWSSEKRFYNFQLNSCEHYMRVI